MQLNHSQQRFVEAPLGNIRLLAPAGCGKTLCLLYRCKHLAEQAAPKSTRFLIVVFTRAAAEELRNRIGSDPQFASIRNAADITTLNAWGFRRIRNSNRNFRLLKDKASYHFAVQNQLRPVWMRYPSIVDAIQRRRDTTRELMNIIDAFKSMAFNHQELSNFETFAKHSNNLVHQGLGLRLAEQISSLIKLGVLNDDTETTHSPRSVYNKFFRFYREASARLIDETTITLEDQKYVAWLEEQSHIEQGSYLSGAARYDHVIVDEFQDINPLDLALIGAIVKRNRATLTIAGDDDQAIFEWRGATPLYIQRPLEFFATDFTTHTLNVNYRSPRNIITASQQLIKHNRHREDKQINAGPGNLDHAELEVWTTEDVSDALDLVQKIATDSLAQGKDLALIGRKRSQLIPYQIHFASTGTHFGAAEDLQIFLSDAFNNVLGLLEKKASLNISRRQAQIIDDLLSLCDSVKRFKLSKGDREALRNHLKTSEATTVVSMLDDLSSYEGPLKGRNDGGKMSMEMVGAVRSFDSAKSVSATLTTLSAHFEGLHPDLGKAEDDIFYTDPPFLYLAEYASRYGCDFFSFSDDIEKAKETLAHLPPFEDETTPSANNFSSPVKLMTAIRAKGKEFDTVVLLDVNDGIWPSRHAETTAEHEAERRVFYVAFTRARKRVIMLVDEKKDWSPYIQECGWPVVNRP